MKRFAGVAGSFLCVVALAAPAQALVPERNLTDEALTRASLNVARSYWGTDQRCPDPYLRVMVWLYGPEPDPLIWARAPLGGCNIFVNATGYQQPPELYCNLIVHEWGHTRGFDHVDDPASIMYPVIDLKVPACEGIASRASAHHRPVKPGVKRVKRRRASFRVGGSGARGA